MAELLILTAKYNFKNYAFGHFTLLKLYFIIKGYFIHGYDRIIHNITVRMDLAIIIVQVLSSSSRLLSFEKLKVSVAEPHASLLSFIVLHSKSW